MKIIPKMFHLFKYKKILVLFLVQLALITIFLVASSVWVHSNTSVGLFGVKFINENEKWQRNRSSSRNIEVIQNVGNFTKNFALIKLNDGYSNHEKVCFREGTKNDTKDISGIFNPVCACAPEWHGKDCGQPEVVWRALMTLSNRQQLNLSTAATAAPRKVPHNIFYIIETNAFHLETLEIQMLELQYVVDLFILCDTVVVVEQNKQQKDLIPPPSISHHKNSGFIKAQKDKILLINDTTCHPRNIYKKLRKLVPESNFKRDDIIIYSQADEILNHRAINYFKWYDNWPQPVRFRLKHNVYGFFWQHPDNTRVASAAATIATLEDSFDSDPSKLSKKPAMIIGDLNHFGGWYCEFCAQAMDVLRQIQYKVQHKRHNDKNINNDNEILNPTKQIKIIDAEYVQNLIVNGRYVDSKLELQQLRRYQEKYYCPDYVTNESWKFDNLVINIFAKWEEDYEN